MVSDRRILVRTPLVNVITRSIYAAVKHTLRDFKEADSLLNTQRGAGRFVQSCRDRIQDLLFEGLVQARPRFGLKIPDEAVTIGEDFEQFWIIDPLSSSENFQQAIPFTAISVAVELKGEVLAGAIYDPLHDEMFYAEKGQGAFVNDRRLVLSHLKDHQEALIGLSAFEDTVDPKGYLLRLGTMKGHVKGFRSLGCAALDIGYLCSGRVHGLFLEETDYTKIAAGLILLKEAGAHFQAVGPEDNPYVGLWTNAHLMDPLKKILKIL